VAILERAVVATTGCSGVYDIASRHGTTTAGGTAIAPIFPMADTRAWAATVTTGDSVLRVVLVAALCTTIHRLLIDNEGPGFRTSSTQEASRISNLGSALAILGPVTFARDWAHGQVAFLFREFVGWWGVLALFATILSRHDLNPLPGPEDNFVQVIFAVLGAFSPL